MTSKTISIPAHTRRSPRKSEAYTNWLLDNHPDLYLILMHEQLVSESIGRQLCEALEGAFAEDPEFRVRTQETY